MVVFAELGSRFLGLFIFGRFGLLLFYDFHSD